MSVLLQHLWPALSAAGLLGFAAALLFGGGAGLPSARLDVRIGAIVALLAGLLVSLLAMVPGRPGLWLDIGVACALAYAGGIGLGSLPRLLVRRRRASPGPDLGTDGL